MAARTFWLAGVMMFTACGASAPDSPYRHLVDVPQLMSWILEPAAEVIWDSAGWVTTAEGEQDLAPVDAEGWAAVRNAAAVVAESGNLLMLPGRAPDLDDWAYYSRDMIDMGRLVMVAADAQDADALFDAGGQLYNVCVACHQRYWITDPPALPGAGARR
jgi:hypothetical protein